MWLLLLWFRKPGQALKIGRKAYVIFVILIWVYWFVEFVNSLSFVFCRFLFL